MIPDEPVRGHIPPPWYGALSGIERVRASSTGRLPLPPLARLLGLRTTHVVPGGITVAMPATEASLAPNGQLQIGPVMVAALEGACSTVMPSGMDFEPLKVTSDPLRPAWLRPGNLLARARVVSSGKLFVLAEVQVEDSDGRHLAQGSLQATVRRLEPAPPPPPRMMPRIEEPTYETPDPYLRRFAVPPPLVEVLEHLVEVLEHKDAASAPLHLADVENPIGKLFGLRMEELTEARASWSMPASEWFCMRGSSVSPAAIGVLTGASRWSAAMTLHQRGRDVVPLDDVVRYFRSVRPDGRRLRSETALTEQAPNLFLAETTIRDADGQVVTVSSGCLVHLDAAQRTRPHRTESRRLVATLLFTDIVDSTQHAERLGDARWRALLEEHKLTVRRELSRHNGTEVDTAGDGFFVRFDSPAQAIEAARAAGRATARLGIEIRAGIHTGECEIEGNRPVGMAVHIAARVQAAAQPGEILVSSTVKDLAVGSGLRFADRGQQNLKGVPDPWRLYAVVD
jgi:class 3 adenylate cyclase